MDKIALVSKRSFSKYTDTLKSQGYTLIRKCSSPKPVAEGDSVTILMPSYEVVWPLDRKGERYRL